MIKKQVISFALNNWKAILIVLLFAVVAMKSKYDYSLIEKAYDTQMNSHRAQIDGLKEIHKQEIRKKQKLMENHLEAIAVIEEEYKAATDMILQLREDKRGDYRNKFNQDREQLIKDIETKFGIQYAP